MASHPSEQSLRFLLLNVALAIATQIQNLHPSHAQAAINSCTSLSVPIGTLHLVQLFLTRLDRTWDGQVLYLGGYTSRHKKTEDLASEIMGWVREGF